MPVDESVNEQPMRTRSEKPGLAASILDQAGTPVWQAMPFHRIVGGRLFRIEDRDGVEVLPLAVILFDLGSSAADVFDNAVSAIFLNHEE